ncbi:MAG: glutamine synthetase family protein [Hyphomicrobiaceae bacterium]|nr:glutamine synthetase family protein [Hyphomicrobiaceae bacterium]
MPGNLTLAQLRKAVGNGEIDTVIAAQVDMQGRLMGKRFQAEHFIDSAVTETHSCNYLLATDMEMETVEGYAASSWAAGYGDYTMIPDLATLRRIPWLEGTALVLCDVVDHHSHEDVPHSPRAILKKQIARLEERGMTAKVATELEFFLFRQSYEEVEASGYRGIDPISPYNEDYHIFQTTKEEDVMRAIRTGLHGAGIPVEGTKGEAECGQEEINISHAGPLECADNHAIAKNGCKEIAWSRNRALTFMAKWDTDMAGSSSHIHQSLWSKDGKTPLFHDPEGEYGMSETMRHYLAGLLTHASEITYFLAPYVNSYKRFAKDTFAPTKAVWALDNRTAGYRVCGDGTTSVRIECRVGGADLNPYLALSASLAAGLDGIEREMELEPEFTGNAYTAENIREIPTTLRAAMDALNGSTMLREAFGGEVVDHYVRAAEWEQEEYDRHVTDWDLKRGFERA